MLSGVRNKFSMFPNSLFIKLVTAKTHKIKILRQNAKNDTHTYCRQIIMRGIDDTVWRQQKVRLGTSLMDGITFKSYYGGPAYMDDSCEHESLYVILIIPVCRSEVSDGGETILIYWNIGSVRVRVVILSRVFSRNEETS